MARGFGSTSGAGTTDKVATPSLTYSTTRSYHMRVLRNGDGGGGNGRYFSTNAQDVSLYAGSGNLNYLHGCSGGSLAGIWSVTVPSTGVLYGVGLSYNSNSASNDPIIYIDGVSASVTETLTPVGTMASPSDVMHIGNRNDSIRVWDGTIEEWAVWNRILNAAEFAALGKGECPLSFPHSLLDYHAMVRPNQGYKLGALSIVGTAIQPHGRVHSKRWAIPATVHVGAPAPPPPGGGHLGQMSHGVRAA